MVSNAPLGFSLLSYEVTYVNVAAEGILTDNGTHNTARRHRTFVRNQEWASYPVAIVACAQRSASCIWHGVSCFSVFFMLQTTDRQALKHQAVVPVALGAADQNLTICR